MIVKLEGHAIGSLRFSASLFRYSLRLLDGLTDGQIASLVGLADWEEFEDKSQVIEHPAAIALIYRLLQRSPRQPQYH